MPLDNIENTFALDALTRTIEFFSDPDHWCGGADIVHERRCLRGYLVEIGAYTNEVMQPITDAVEEEYRNGGLNAGLKLIHLRCPDRRYDGHPYDATRINDALGYERLMRLLRVARDRLLVR